MCSKNKCHPQAENIGEHFEESTIGTFLQNAVDISGSVPYDNIERNYNVGFVESINSEVLNRENQFKKRMKRSKSTSALYRSSGQNSDSAESSSSSLDSLIKNELVGTKALQPLSVFKAKERNYLHGRSGAESLLGPAELNRIFPTHEVTIHVCTWNMNGEEPPSNLNELFLSEKMTHLPDIYVIGTQESYSERSEWEISIQETIGPTHVLFHSETLGTIFLAVFIRRELIWYCSLPEDDAHSVRAGSAFKTKGGVGMCFYLFGSSFLFIVSHLTAHDDKLQDRIHDVSRIMKSLELPKELPVIKRMMRNRVPNVANHFDYVFWFGDLNFRITQPRQQVLDWVRTTKFPTNRNVPLPFSDQLTCSMKRGEVFRGFQEAPITFPPSYKFDKGTQIYDTSSKKRTPSYTDRILFKMRRSTKSILSSMTNYTNMKCLAYSSVPSFCTSDHKPVWALFTCKLRPGIDTIPLAAGWFNREVYLEALKRRAANPLSDSKSCSIQ